MTPVLPAHALETAVPAATGNDRRVACLPAPVWLLLPPAALLVTYAYARAAFDPAGGVHFHLFWAGVLLFSLPAIGRLCAAGVSHAERVAVIVAVGLFDFLPKFLRDPQMPAYYDELAHWRQAEVVYATGRLFQPNPLVKIAQYFPGLHALTAALRDLSGLSTMHLAIVLLALLHVLALVGVFCIGESLTGSARTGGIAAFIYSLNASYMFFDTQYAYESLGLVFFIWAIVAVVRMQAAADDRGTRTAWVAAGIVVVLACVVTHHLSSYATVGTLSLITLVAVGRSLRRHEKRATVLASATLTLVALGAAVAWLLPGVQRMMIYLTPHLGGGLMGLTRLLGHEQHARALFVHSTTPVYERVSAFLSPPVAAVASLAGLWLLHRRRARLSAHGGLVLLAGTYFASLPLMLTQSGAEGAERSWAFSYLGVAVLVAPVIPWLLERRAALRRLAGAGVAAALCVLLIGNVAMHMPEDYRFPGPYEFGSDTRAATPELHATVRWFRATQGTGRLLVADRYNGLAFATEGMDWPMIPWGGFPVWQLYFRTGLPDPAMLRAMAHAPGLDFLIVDKRMVRDLPRIGFYFDPAEPEASHRSKPLPAAAIAKYDGLPWTIKVYESSNLDVYRFNFAVLGARWTPRLAGTRGMRHSTGHRHTRLHASHRVMSAAPERRVVYTERRYR